MNDDSRLILELNASSRKAFTELYHKYIGMVMGFISKMLKDRSLSEDLAQYCFLQLWNHRENIASDRNLPAYLYVTAKNAVLKELQRQDHAARFADYAMHCQEGVVLPSIALDSKVVMKEVIDVVSSLPESRRRIFEMKVIEGKTCPAIATELGLSVKTVETQVSRSIKALKKSLEKLA